MLPGEIGPTLGREQEQKICILTGIPTSRGRPGLYIEEAYNASKQVRNDINLEIHQHIYSNTLKIILKFEKFS